MHKNAQTIAQNDLMKPIKRKKKKTNKKENDYLSVFPSLLKLGIIFFVRPLLLMLKF